ncbi:MAG: hypothetical protein ABH867_00205 [Patescibacteria group bacterium]|nr:hypothetical protein [Patescibacteria group bacterium]
MQTKNKKLFWISLLFFSMVVSRVTTGVWAQTGLREKVKEIRQESQEIREEAREMFQKAREDYLQARTEINSWRRLSEYEKQGDLAPAKNFVKRSIAMAVRHLSRWQVRLEAMEAVSRTVKDQAVAEIKKAIDWLNQKETAVDQAATVDEIRTIGQEVRRYWQGKRWLVKKMFGLTLVSRARSIESRSQTVMVKLEAAVNAAEQAGKDVADAKLLLSDLKEKSSEISAKIAQAEEKFNAIADSENCDALFREGNQLLKEAYQEINSFRDTARELWQKIKE